MEDLVDVVQDDITVEKLKRNVRFHHGIFETFHQLFLSQLIISSVILMLVNPTLLRHELVFTPLQNLNYIIYSSYCFDPQSYCLDDDMDTSGYPVFHVLNVKSSTHIKMGNL